MRPYTAPSLLVASRLVGLTNTQITANILWPEDPIAFFCTLQLTHKDSNLDSLIQNLTSCR